MATMTVFAFVLLYLCYFQNVTGVTEREVVDMLLTGYQKEGRPVQDPTQAVVTSLDVFLIQIVKLVPQRQVLIVNLWLLQRWKDDFLSWNPAEHGNISSIRLGINKIWRARLVHYNRQHEEGWSKTPDTNAIVRSNGEVLWAYPITIHSTCVLDIVNFPFDVQRCPLKFGSWTYDASSLKLLNVSVRGNMDEFIENGEWTLMSFDLEVNHVEYSCCPGVLWDDMTYTITIKRRSKFYVLYFVSPSVLMAFMAVCGFWLPPDSGERLLLCFTLLLSLTWLLQVVTHHLPDTATSIPLISAFFIATILLAGTSAALTIFTLSLHFKTFDLQPVPKWLRYIFCLGPLHPNIVNAPKANDHEDMDASFVTDDAMPMEALQPSRTLRARNVLQHLKDEHQSMSRYGRLEKEWKILAGKIDRCLLVAFFIVLVVLTGGIFGPHV
ncbi:CHRNA9 [Branchiostoma lanceolatum]|uniref:CHRNA9 protein n=1 Tax=Branchiostoma lanceolatum TaxID=7740 RepID=A0A8J9ZF94_BRALA|nr:CHRNA9 [Branchiostoma lanceolatum]